MAAVDLQRLQSETLLTFGALKPNMLADMNRSLDKFQAETGIDPRVFEAAAFGLNYKNANAEQFVVLLQGRFDAASLIEKGFAAAQKKKAKIKREARQYEGFTLFVVNENGKAQARPLAVFALDGNTVAFGEVSGLQSLVQARLGRAPRVDDELVTLATRNSNALFSFGGNIPPEMVKDWGGKEGEKFVSLARGIRRFAGAVNTVGLDVDADLSLFTETSGQASELRDVINGFRLLFGSSLRPGGAARKNGPDSFSKFINSVQISAQNNEVQMRLNLKEADVRQLLGAF